MEGFECYTDFYQDLRKGYKLERNMNLQKFIFMACQPLISDCSASS
jgi:hypothetical protein